MQFHLDVDEFVKNSGCVHALSAMLLRCARGWARYRQAKLAGFGFKVDKIRLAARIATRYIRGTDGTVTDCVPRLPPR